MMDVITTKLVRAKLAQDNGLVYVSSTMHRTFGPGEWQQLHQLLKSVSKTRKTYVSSHAIILE